MPYIVLSQCKVQPMPKRERCEGVWKIYPDSELELAERMADTLRDEMTETQVVRVPWPRKGWK